MRFQLPIKHYTVWLNDKYPIDDFNNLATAYKCMTDWMKRNDFNHYEDYLYILDENDEKVTPKQISETFKPH